MGNRQQRRHPERFETAELAPQQGAAAPAGFLQIGYGVIRDEHDRPLLAVFSWQHMNGTFLVSLTREQLEGHRHACDELLEGWPAGPQLEIAQTVPSVPSQGE